MTSHRFDAAGPRPVPATLRPGRQPLSHIARHARQGPQRDRAQTTPNGGSGAAAYLSPGHVPSRPGRLRAALRPSRMCGRGGRTRHDEQHRVIVNVAAGFRSGSSDVPYPPGVTFCAHIGWRVTNGDCRSGDAVLPQRSRVRTARQDERVPSGDQQPHLSQVRTDEIVKRDGGLRRRYCSARMLASSGRRAPSGVTMTSRLIRPSLSSAFRARVSSSDIC